MHGTNAIINIRLVASCWFLSLHPGIIKFNESLGETEVSLNVAVFLLIGFGIRSESEGQLATLNNQQQVQEC